MALIHRGGDDLEDDYAPDELVALSDVDEAEEFAPLEDEEDQFVVDDDAPPAPAKSNNKKSSATAAAAKTGVLDPKVDAANNGDIGAQDGLGDANTRPLTAEEEAKREKKRKRRAKDNERKAKKQRLTLPDPSAGPNASSAPPLTGSQSPAAIAALLRKGQAQVFSTLSEVELDDLRIPESCIADTTKWNGARTLETLPEFIKQVVPTLATRIAQRSKDNGAPTCIMLAANANRVTDLTRAFRPLRGEKGGEVCKLFARHFQLAAHVEHLKKTKVGVAVGTPGRVSALLNDTDALSIRALSHILLDVSFLDTKNRSLLDTRETKEEIFKGLFTNKRVLERMREGKCVLVFF